MTTVRLPSSEDGLLHDLVRSLTQPTAASEAVALSVGVVGHALHASRPPDHCLQACLAGDPAALETRGCAWLRAVARGDVSVPAPEDGRCGRGFRVAAQQTTLGGGPAALVTIEGPRPTAGTPRPAELSAAAEHLETVARLVQRVDELLSENVGFAEEVLRNYEQLNLIFDLTQQVALVADPRAIEALLLHRVCRLLEADTVHLLTHTGECRSYDARAVSATTTPHGAEFQQPDAVALIEQVRRTRQVQVATLGGRQVILGVLVRLDQKVDVALAMAPAGRAPFTSGDMMIIESVLAFGGQIISNSELHERLRRMSVEVTRALVAAIDKKDHYTSGHSERCGFLTRLVAQALDIPPAEQEVMEWSGLLHDVGKIGIPEEILCKPGKLTPAEFEIVKQHPRMGYEILQPIASMGVILDGVLYHHEYTNGSGYPDRLAGEQIPLVARIIHVADTFDALTSTRSYRKPFTLAEAYEIITRELGVRIDVNVGRTFLHAFEKYRREQPEDFASRFGHILIEEHAHARD